MYYILDKNNKPKKVKNVLVWAKWFEETDRRVKTDDFETMHLDPVRISTIFMGLDCDSIHDQGCKAAPYLWETMVFGGIHDGLEVKYCSAEDALQGHNQIVEKVKKSL